MKFLIPLTVESLSRDDLVGRAVVPVYVNPETFNIQNTKIISETLTKGGYAVQYWGEQLSEIQAGGSTGSGGIEAINILYAIYKNEISQFNKILLERSVLLSDVTQSAISDTSKLNVGTGITSILNELTQGGFSDIVDGTKSAIEQITNSALGITENNPNSIELIPSIGAFAVSMILYWQGEKFTGYFKNFRVDENASSPGIFNYQFTFMVTKRSGTRTNFMPWHRSPVDSSGQPISASIPRDGPQPNELSFETNSERVIFKGQLNQSNPDIINSATSKIKETQESQKKVINAVPLSRNGIIKGNK
jgi:hypothetical protein